MAAAVAATRLVGVADLLGPSVLDVAAGFSGAGVLADVGAFPAALEALLPVPFFSTVFFFAVTVPILKPKTVLVFVFVLQDQTPFGPARARECTKLLPNIHKIFQKFLGILPAGGNNCSGNAVLAHIETHQPLVVTQV